MSRARVRSASSTGRGQGCGLRCGQRVTRQLHRGQRGNLVGGQTMGNLGRGDIKKMFKLCSYLGVYERAFKPLPRPSVEVLEDHLCRSSAVAHERAVQCHRHALI